LVGALSTVSLTRALETGAEAAGMGWDAVVRVGAGCSATILTNGLLLSAAHCGIRQLENTVISRNSNAIQIGSCRDPDDWSLANGRDVAVCELPVYKARIKGLRLAESDELQSLPIGAPLILVGYGQQSSPEARKSTNPSWGQASLVQVSTGLIVYSESGVCPGDSGGPVLADIHGERLIVGIISARLRAAQPCSPGYSYAVRSDNVLQWYSGIHSSTKPAHEPPSRGAHEEWPVVGAAWCPICSENVVLAGAIAGAGVPILGIALLNAHAIQASTDAKKVLKNLYDAITCFGDSRFFWSQLDSVGMQ
jgi:V8-like Glu-specific endopeptidase